MKVKRLIKILTLLLIVIVAFSATACSGEYPSGGGDYYVPKREGYSPSIDGEYEGTRDDKSTESPDGSATTESPDGSATTEKDSEIVYGPGTITAGAYNDNTYYTSFKSLFYEQNATESKNDARFAPYLEPWRLDPLHRVKVTVTCDEQKVAGADVILTQGDKIFKGVTDANGVAYVFGNGSEGVMTVASGDGKKEVPVTAETTDLDVELETCLAKQNVIDIMFVVDVTGSMGDELEYLKTELGDVIAQIAQSDFAPRINLALLFYRDTDDAEKFSYSDFQTVTTEEGLKIQQDALNHQFADGGGDYPEAVDEALLSAVDKQWTSGTSTKIIFHVLDAPAHTGDIYAKRYASAVTSAAAKGIRICPILASGANTLAEYLTRVEAVMTGGTFVFITDDSGIGEAHYDPDLPNVVVEHLNALIVRLVNGYHTGTFAPPVPWNAPQVSDHKVN